ncbi:MAG: hypothetical protein ACQKBW_00075, partial [Puniceicoccales bacterium]
MTSRNTQLISWFLLMICLAFFPRLSVAEDTAKTLSRDAWSFDRSHLEWYPWAKPDESKKKGDLNAVSGWAEYDFEAPEAGWYEIWTTGMPSGWTRTIYIDGEKVYEHMTATPLDEESNMVKEGNVWLSAGQHSIRFHRVTFPGVLPKRWELRPANGSPEGSIQVLDAKHFVARVSEPQIVTLWGGGTGQPMSYELVLLEKDSDEVISAGQVGFPATSEPIEKTVEVVIPKEGVFYLTAKVDGVILKPSDLKSRDFIGVNAEHGEVPPGAVKTTPVVDIDCTATPPEDGFWEKEG